MQQSTRRFVLLLGTTLFCAGALLAAACSTDNRSSSELPQVDADRTDTGGGSSSGNPGDGGSNDASPDCSSAPQLHSNDYGFYCSFLNRDAAAVVNPRSDGGDPRYCTTGDTCCTPPLNSDNSRNLTFCGASKLDTAGCAAYATARADAGLNWPNNGKPSSAWQCADKNNCGNGEVCCLVSMPDAGGTVNIGNTIDNDIPKACNAKMAFKQAGTRCKASCAAGSEIQLCSKGDDWCTGGTKCTPFETFFRDLAYCAAP